MPGGEGIGMAEFCSACGSRLSANERFCSTCGAAVALSREHSPSGSMWWAGTVGTGAAIALGLILARIVLGIATAAATGALSGAGKAIVEGTLSRYSFAFAGFILAMAHQVGLTGFASVSALGAQIRSTGSIYTPVPWLLILVLVSVGFGGWVAARVARPASWMQAKRVLATFAACYVLALILGYRLAIWGGVPLLLPLSKLNLVDVTLDIAIRPAWLSLITHGALIALAFGGAGMWMALRRDPWATAELNLSRTGEWVRTFVAAAGAVVLGWTIAALAAVAVISLELPTIQMESRTQVRVRDLLPGIPTLGGFVYLSAHGVPVTSSVNAKALGYGQEENVEALFSVWKGQWGERGAVRRLPIWVRLLGLLPFVAVFAALKASKQSLGTQIPVKFALAYAAGVLAVWWITHIDIRLGGSGSVMLFGAQALDVRVLVGPNLIWTLLLALLYGLAACYLSNTVLGQSSPAPVRRIRVSHRLRYCESCGGQLTPDSVFCDRCGALVGQH